MIEGKYLVIRIDKGSTLPAATQLANQLTCLIADGVLTKSEKLPPIREYAKVLDVHHHTVRAAYHQLEENQLVTIRPKIGTIVQEYHPFLSKKRLNFVENDLIGILVPSLSDFYQEIISGIESVALENKLIPVVVNCHDDPYYAEGIYRNLSARNVIGIINISLGFSDDFDVEFSKDENLNVPLVFLDVTDAKTHSLTINTSDAIYQAACHLIDHGCEDLALVNCPEDWPIGREALRGFERALKTKDEADTHSRIYTASDFKYASGEFIAERIVKSTSLPRGIVTVSDHLALGLLTGLSKYGIRIPQDVTIIGFNDIFAVSIVNPPLTSIALPLFEMGKQAMLVMNQILQGNVDKWIHKKFSGKLVVRESCGCEVEK
jgi:DNA-binding LacI/PurR family transcriptional regulator